MGRAVSLSSFDDSLIVYMAGDVGEHNGSEDGDSLVVDSPLIYRSMDNDRVCSTLRPALHIPGLKALPQKIE